MNKGNSHRKQNDSVTLTYHWGELWHPKTKKWAKNHMSRLYRRKKNMELKAEPTTALLFRIFHTFYNEGGEIIV